MQENINNIKESLVRDLESVNKPQDIVDLKAKYVGKSGCITELTKNGLQGTPGKILADTFEKIKPELKSILDEIEKIKDYSNYKTIDFDTTMDDLESVLRKK